MSESSDQRSVEPPDDWLIQPAKLLWPCLFCFTAHSGQQSGTTVIPLIASYVVVPRIVKGGAQSHLRGFVGVGSENLSCVRHIGTCCTFEGLVVGWFENFLNLLVVVPWALAKRYISTYSSYVPYGCVRYLMKEFLNNNDTISTIYVKLISTSPLSSTERLNPSSVIMLLCCCIAEEGVLFPPPPPGVGTAMEDELSKKLVDFFSSLSWSSGNRVVNCSTSRNARLSSSELNGSSGLRLNAWWYRSMATS